jgi:hypothetical protein
MTLTVAEFMKSSVRKTALRIVLEHLDDVIKLRAQAVSKAAIAEFLTRKTGVRVYPANIRQAIEGTRNGIDILESIRQEVAQMNERNRVRKAILSAAGLLEEGEPVSVKMVTPEEKQAKNTNSGPPSTETANPVTVSKAAASRSLLVSPAKVSPTLPKEVRAWGTAPIGKSPSAQPTFAQGTRVKNQG